MICLHMCIHEFKQTALLRPFQVLIFSQWTKVLDIFEYYFYEKSIEVCRIDGRVKLDERRRQVTVVRFSCYLDYVYYTVLFCMFGCSCLLLFNLFLPISNGTPLHLAQNTFLCLIRLWQFRSLSQCPVWAK